MVYAGCAQRFQRVALIALTLVVTATQLRQILEHPFARVFDDAPDVDDLYVKYPYFPQDQPLRFDLEHAYAYAGPPVKLQNGTTYQWPHGIGEVVTALIDAGLRIEFLHEFPFGYTTLPFRERVEDWMFRLTKHDGSVPLLYSIRATKPN